MQYIISIHNDIKYIKGYSNKQTVLPSHKMRFCVRLQCSKLKWPTQSYNACLSNSLHRKKTILGHCNSWSYFLGTNCSNQIKSELSRPNQTDGLASCECFSF